MSSFHKRQRPKEVEVTLWLRVENNNKFVSGKTRVRVDIENYVLARYNMKKLRKDGGKYLLTIPYIDEADLEKKVDNLYEEMQFQVGGKHCFIEADITNPFTGYSF